MYARTLQSAQRVVYAEVLVSRVCAVLANEDDALDSERRRASGQCLGNAWIEGDPVPFGAAAGEVVVGELIHVDRNELDLGRAPPALPGIATDQTVEKVLSVGVSVINRADEGDRLAGRGARSDKVTLEPSGK